MEKNIFSTEPKEFTLFFINKFSSLSDGQYAIALGNPKIIRKGYYEIYESSQIDSWKACRFHFEISWKDNLTLQETYSINVLAHIERPCDSKEPQITERIRATFSKKTKDNIIISEPIIVDFSSEETTLKSINSILKVLKSDKYQRIAAKVKELL